MLGELLANDTSRRIIEILSDHTLYTVEIEEKVNIRTSLTIWHLNKLVKLKMLIITNKEIHKKSIDHKHYKMKPEFHIDELRKII